jgi:hypothetical protein
VTEISAKELAICISKKLIMQYQAALSWFFCSRLHRIFKAAQRTFDIEIPCGCTTAIVMHNELHNIRRK